MTTTSAVLHAAAQRLAAAGIAVWSPEGIFPPGTPAAITLKSVPTAPDRVLTLTVYGIDESPDPADDLRDFSLQVRARGLAFPPTDVDDLAEAARDVLTVHHTVWGDVVVDRCRHISTIPLGADANRRQERTDNYRLITRR